MREAFDRLSCDREHDVAFAQACAMRRPPAGASQEDDGVMSFRGIDPKPGPRRPSRQSTLAEIVQDRRQQIDRHDHIERHDLGTVDLLGHLQTSDPDQIALRPIMAVPPQFGCAGAVKTASSRTYSQ